MEENTWTEEQLKEFLEKGNVDPEKLVGTAKELLEDPLVSVYQQMTKTAQPVTGFSNQSNTIANTLAERGSRYGEFADHAVIAQALQDSFRVRKGWNKLAPDMRQALTVMADKIARILNGDPTYIDNWHDIQGYAKLVEDRLKKEQQ